MKSTIIVSTLTVISLLPTFAHANDCPPGMTGSTKTMVRYLMGPNSEKFGQFRKAHVDFLIAQMKSGQIQLAGPFLTADGIDGGMMIVNTADLKQADAFIQGDEVIKQKVFTYE